MFYLFPDSGNVTRGPQAGMLARTGTAVGGSGGVDEGRVSQVIVKDASHPSFPFEKPTECVQEMARAKGTMIRVPLIVFDSRRSGIRSM